jgi:hypothetical protein
MKCCVIWRLSNNNNVSEQQLLLNLFVCRQLRTNAWRSGSDRRIGSENARKTTTPASGKNNTSLDLLFFLAYPAT